MPACASLPEGFLILTEPTLQPTRQVRSIGELMPLPCMCTRTHVHSHMSADLIEMAGSWCMRTPAFPPLWCLLCSEVHVLQSLKLPGLYQVPVTSKGGFFSKSLLPGHIFPISPQPSSTFNSQLISCLRNKSQGLLLKNLG